MKDRTEYLKAYRERNKEKYRQYYIDNKEKINKRKSEYYKSHKEEHKKVSKDYYWRHKDKISIKMKTRYRLPKYRFFALKSTAKQRGLLVEISFNDFITITENPCQYCGSESLGKYGIDRINSSLGYLKDNCVSCCSKCNFMKLDLTTEDFLNHIKKIYIHNDKL